MADEAQSTLTSASSMKEFVAGRLRKKRPEPPKKGKPSPEVMAGKEPKRGRYGFPQQDDTVNWD